MSGIALIGFLLAMVVVATVSDWRKGLLCCIPVGFLQDPARKMTVGEPVWMVIAATLAMTVVLVAYIGRRNPIFIPILMERTRVRPLLGLLLFLVVLQTFHTLLDYDAQMLAALGLLFYLLPLPALALASNYPRRPDDIYRFLLVYVTFAVILGISVILSWSGNESILFSEVGEGLRIYDASAGNYIDAFTGIARSPEVAAWHLGTGACMALIIALGLRKRSSWILWTLIAVFLLTCGLLTGRRKMLMEIVVFLAVFTGFGLLFRSSAAWKSLLLSGLLGVCLFAAVPQFDESSLITIDPSQPTRQSLSPYLARSMTSFSEAGERMSALGLGSIYWAYNRAGFFGAGVGAAAQGAQHFGGQRLGGAGEGGLGRITGELGIPGLLLVVLTGLALFRIVYARLKRATAVKHPNAPLAIALVSFLCANLPIFIAASQVYSDPFVLFVIACCGGFALRTMASLGAQTAPRRVPVGQPVRAG